MKIKIPAHLTGQARRHYMKSSRIVRAGTRRGLNRRRQAYWLNEHARLLKIPKKDRIRF